MRRLLMVAGLALALPAAAVDRYVPGSENDPRIRSAEFLIGDQRYFSASSELLQVLGDTPQQRLSPVFYRRLADATLNFGIVERAETIYRELGVTRDNALSLARARLRVAEFLYQRGHHTQAIADLKSMRPSLPKQALLQWQDLLGRVLIAERRYGEAVDVLTAIKDAGPQRAYTRYNLGVALVNDGRVGQGVNVLDRVGQIAASDPDDLALRDKANLTLAYHFLRKQQAGTAISIFQRIRSDGPMANRALLGLGWAYLAPTGKAQKKVAVGDEGAPDDAGNAFRSLSTIGVLLRPGFLDDDIYRRAGLQAFRLTRVSAEQEAALKRALVPWIELVSRDPIDPAVQEGLLAIPYTLDRLGAHIQAQQFYEQAIAALEAARKRLDDTSAYVKSGRMIKTMVRRTADAESGWAWELKDLPDADETYYLKELIAGNRFQEQLKNYRDALLMQRSLEGWAERAAALQATWLERGGPAMPTDVLLAAPLARRPTDSAAAPVVPTPPVRLQASTALSPPSGVTAPPAASEPTVALQTAASPEPRVFVGTYERLEVLKLRVDALLPRAVSIADRQARALEAMALTDLAGQRAVTEKYLIEARFALARVYDQQFKGVSP